MSPGGRSWATVGHVLLGHWRRWPVLLKVVAVFLTVVTAVALVLAARGDTDYDACDRLYSLMDSGVHAGREYADDYRLCTGLQLP